MTYYPLYYQIDSGLNLAKAPVIMTSASGSVASFPDGAADLPVKSLQVAINPVQDLHGYDNPWPAGGGKNKLNAPDITLEEAGTVYSGPISLAAGTYTLSSSNTDISVTVGEDSGVMPLTFTLAEAIEEIEITASAAGEFKNLQIEAGSSATTYAPYSNVCPISGHTGVNVTRTGKNLLPQKKFQYTQTQVQLGGETIEEAYKRLKAGTYTLSVQALVSVGCYYKIGSGTGVSIGQNGGTFTLSEDANVVIYCYKSGSLSADDITRWQLELGSTVTAYEPYQGVSIPITFPAEAGTVYGGELTINQDGTGELVVDMGYNQLLSSALSGFESGYSSSAMAAGNKPIVWFRNVFINEAKDRISGGIKALCNAFKILFNNTHIFQSQNRCAFVVDGVNIDSVEDFISAVQTLENNGNGLFIAFELSTPITTTLTAPQVRTLLGINNIWADTGDTTATYRADTKLYIEQLTQPDADMIADSNITSGKFFMVGNRLFLSTAAIEQGAAIVPGTNCTEMSLADALNTLNT